MCVILFDMNKIYIDIVIKNYNFEFCYWPKVTSPISVSPLFKNVLILKFISGEYCTV